MIQNLPCLLMLLYAQAGGDVLSFSSTLASFDSTCAYVPLLDIITFCLFFPIGDALSLCL